MMALFKTETVVVTMPDESETIKKAIAGLMISNFLTILRTAKSFWSATSLPLSTNKNCSIRFNNLPFVKSIDDNVVVDEYVWENMNALLMTNPNWIGVSIYSPTPGNL